MTAEKIDGCIKLSVPKITEEPTQAESEELSVKLGRWPLNGRLTPDKSITGLQVTFVPTQLSNHMFAPIAIRRL